jgi:hypothetical protein
LDRAEMAYAVAKELRPETWQQILWLRKMVASV